MSTDNLAMIRHAVTSPREVADRLGLKVDKGASRGNRIRVLCPAHNEKRAACSIGERDGELVWHCFACDAGGDLFALVAVVHGLDPRTEFPRIVELAADTVGVTLPAKGEKYTPRAPDPDRHIIALTHAIDAQADDWIDGRWLGLDWVDDPKYAFRPSKSFASPNDRTLFMVLDVVRESDAQQRAEAEMDRRLNEVGDYLEATGRLEWPAAQPPVRIRDRAARTDLDVPSLLAEMPESMREWATHRIAHPVFTRNDIADAKALVLQNLELLREIGR